MIHPDNLGVKSLGRCLGGFESLSQVAKVCPCSVIARLDSEVVYLVGGIKLRRFAHSQDVDEVGGFHNLGGFRIGVHKGDARVVEVGGAVDPHRQRAVRSKHPDKEVVERLAHVALGHRHLVQFAHRLLRGMLLERVGVQLQHLASTDQAVYDGQCL